MLEPRQMSSCSFISKSVDSAVPGGGNDRLYVVAHEWSGSMLMIDGNALEKRELVDAAADVDEP